MILSLIIITLSIYSGIYAFLHNMQMLQLNGYRISEHLNWFKKNLRSQWLLYAGLVTGILDILFGNILSDIFSILLLSLTSLVYNVFHKINNRKRLKFTMRVKRMLVTEIFLSGLFLYGFFLLYGFLKIKYAFFILSSSQFFLPLLSNMLNIPMEKFIGLYYIRDAEREIGEAKKRGLKVIGITGSFGKTSLKYYLRALLSEKYEIISTPGNFNTPFGVTRTVRGKMSRPFDFFICEMGARHVGDIKELCQMTGPDYGIITSIGPQHLETFHSIENIINTKFELADSISGDGFMLLNLDDEYIRAKSSEYKRCFFYSAADNVPKQYMDRVFLASDISVSPLGTEFTVNAPDGESEHFRMKLLGNLNVLNVTGAIAFSHLLGIKLKDLRLPVRRLEMVPHRLELKSVGQMTVIDDAYNSNPSGSEAALKVLSSFSGLRILISPGMVELGEKEYDLNREFGIKASEVCDFIFLTGSRKHSEPILLGIRSQGFPEDHVFITESFDEAFRRASNIKYTGQKVLLLENDLPDNY